MDLDWQLEAKQKPVSAEYIVKFERAFQRASKLLGSSAQALSLWGTTAIPEGTWDRSIERVERFQKAIDFIESV